MAALQDTLNRFEYSGSLCCLFILNKFVIQVASLKLLTPGGDCYKSKKPYFRYITVTSLLATTSFHILLLDTSHY